MNSTTTEAPTTENGLLIDPIALKLSPTQIAILDVLKAFKGFQGVSETRIIKETGLMKGHVRRGLSDMASRGIIESRQYKNSDTMYSLPSGTDVKDPASHEWVECDHPGCDRQFSDYTAMNIHKAKKHPESRERIDDDVADVTEGAEAPEIPQITENAPETPRRAHHDAVAIGQFINSASECIELQGAELVATNLRGKKYRVSISAPTISLDIPTLYREGLKNLLEIAYDMDRDQLTDIENEDPEYATELRTRIRVAEHLLKELKRGESVNGNTDCNTQRITDEGEEVIQ